MPDFRNARSLIGGIGYRWCGDSSWGLVVTDELARMEWPAGIDVQDLGYGALHVAQDLANAHPRYERAILLAAQERGRVPGQIYEYEWRPGAVAPDEMQARIREAGAGVIDLDHLLAIASYFRALPDDVTIMEYEPADSDKPDGLSAAGTSMLNHAITEIRARMLGNAEVVERTK